MISAGRLPLFAPTDEELVGLWRQHCKTGDTPSPVVLRRFFNEATTPQRSLDLAFISGYVAGQEDK